MLRCEIFLGLAIAGGVILTNPQYFGAKRSFC